MLQNLNITEYLQWTEKNHWFEKRFEILANQFFDYICVPLSDINSSGKDIINNVKNVMGKCNTIDFNNENIARAYAMMHFLDRYHRAIITFKYLIKYEIFPSYRKYLDILDVGTGPGSYLYAVSDIYLSITEFSRFSNSPYMDGKKIKIDYVEKGEGFRLFLNSFTQKLNAWASENNIPEWDVPYSHGSFYDFSDIQFNLRGVNFFIKHRYNLISMSNFLTLEKDITTYEKQIYNSLKFLRNNGSLVIIGSASDQYKTLYKKLINSINNMHFTNKRFRAHVSFRDENILKSDFTDSMGIIKKEYFKKLQSFLLDNNYPLNDYFKDLLDEICDQNYKKENSWRLLVFQKHSKFKGK